MAHLQPSQGPLTQCYLSLVPMSWWAVKSHFWPWVGSKWAMGGLQVGRGWAISGLLVGHGWVASGPEKVHGWTVY